MKNNTRQYDAIIIGAGLAGLTAAVNLQNAGYKVLVLEKNPSPGGLCGIFISDQYEFVIGCNDFCEKVYKILSALHVKVDFRKSKMKFYVEDTLFEFPPTVTTYLKFLRYPFDLLRMIKYYRKGIKENETLESFVDNNIKNQTFSDFIKSFCYPYGMAPRDLALKQLQEEFSSKYQYNYQRPVVPTNSPQDMTNALIEKFMQLGGELKLNTYCQKIVKENALKKVITLDNEFLARVVLTTEGRYESYPINFRAGLCISKFIVAVKRNLSFPKDFHTIAYFPHDVSRWFTQIDNGELPEKFGFHLFPHVPKNRDDYYSLNIYFYLPRTMNSIPQEQIEKIQKSIFSKIEELLPGFHQNTIYSKFISAEEFKKLHGVSSSTSPIIDPQFEKPPIYDSDNDIYYIGNTVYPPGNHAGATMLSAMIAADEVRQRLKLEKK